MNINIDNLNVLLSNRLVLRDISLWVPSGASVAVVGMSGAGKTTLLRCVAGLTPPSRGQVSIDGKHPKEFYGQGLLSFLFQEACLWPHLTVWQTLELTFKLHGRSPDTAQIIRRLEMVGLTNASRLYPYQLSVGMKARTAIARAFCIPPRVLLMDEPFAAIDPLRRPELNRQVQDLRQEYGCTVMWVTHHVVEALQFATHAIAIAPPPDGTATMIDLTGIPLIEDSASLPKEALLTRDRILDIIKGERVSDGKGVCV